MKDMEVKDKSPDAGIPRDRESKRAMTARAIDVLAAELEAAFAINPIQATPAIGTKGMFPMMELPSELRVEILNYLLLIHKPINIQALDDAGDIATSHAPRPSASILQTCKEINREGTPILYSQNKFIICLSINLNNFLAIEPGPSSTLANSLFVRTMRWTTIAELTSISFISSSTFIPGDDEGQNMNRPRPAFKCTGEDILARFQAADIVSSPSGPDKYMALSISNWISMKVMREELGAFQRALKAMMADDIRLPLVP